MFRINVAGALTCAIRFPPVTKSKMCYMLKRTPDKIDQKNFRTVNITSLIYFFKCCIMPINLVAFVHLIILNKAFFFTSNQDLTR